jgi:hypothetical protein
MCILLLPPLPLCLPHNTHNSRERSDLSLEISRVSFLAPRASSNGSRGVLLLFVSFFFLSETLSVLSATHVDGADGNALHVATEARFLLLARLIRFPVRVWACLVGGGWSLDAPGCRVVNSDA